MRHLAIVEPELVYSVVPARKSGSRAPAAQPLAACGWRGGSGSNELLRSASQSTLSSSSSVGSSSAEREIAHADRARTALAESRSCSHSGVGRSEERRVGKEC